MITFTDAPNPAIAWIKGRWRLRTMPVELKRFNGGILAVESKRLDRWKKAVEFCKAHRP